MASVTYFILSLAWIFNWNSFELLTRRSRFEGVQILYSQCPQSSFSQELIHSEWHSKPSSAQQKGKNTNVTLIQYMLNSQEYSFNKHDYVFNKRIHIHQAVDVAQMVEWVVPTSEIRGSNPIIGILLTINYIEKTKIKKMQWMAHLKHISTYEVPASKKHKNQRTEKSSSRLRSAFMLS